MSTAGRGRQRLPACRTNDPDLWFAGAPADLERAKRLCFDCPLRAECLADAQARVAALRFGPYSM